MRVVPIIAGSLLSGQAAIWGARLAGHDSKAGYPFPDVKGFFLFLLGVLVIPAVVAGVTGIMRRIPSAHDSDVKISIPTAILVFGPLLGFVVGCSLESVEQFGQDRRKAYEKSQKEAYPKFAAQVIADPSIVLCQRWFEPYSSKRMPRQEISARDMVFEHSFKPDHLTVAYTSEQLKEICERAPAARMHAVFHPRCPSDWIERMWPEVISSRQAWAIKGIMENPSTPRHLFEEYEAERVRSNRSSAGWVDETVEKRLKRDP